MVATTTRDCFGHSNVILACRHDAILNGATDIKTDWPTGNRHTEEIFASTADVGATIRNLLGLPTDPQALERSLNADTSRLFTEAFARALPDRLDIPPLNSSGAPTDQHSRRPQHGRYP